jgi:plasmid stability protein
MHFASIALVPNVQIRNVPEDVHARLKERAAYAGQSLNEYLLQQMREIASLPTIAEMTERLRARSDKAYDGPGVGEIAAIIREERGSR